MNINKLYHILESHNSEYDKFTSYNRKFLLTYDDSIKVQNLKNTILEGISDSVPIINEKFYSVVTSVLNNEKINISDSKNYPFHCLIFYLLHMSGVISDEEYREYINLLPNDNVKFHIFEDSYQNNDMIFIESYISENLSPELVDKIVSLPYYANRAPDDKFLQASFFPASTVFPTAASFDNISSSYFIKKRQTLIDTLIKYAIISENNDALWYILSRIDRISLRPELILTYVTKSNYEYPLFLYVKAHREELLILFEAAVRIQENLELLADFCIKYLEMRPSEILKLSFNAAHRDNERIYVLNTLNKSILTVQEILQFGEPFAIAWANNLESDI